MAPLLPALVVCKVCKTYEPSNEVLRDISTIVHPGETLAVVGPSGSGKSTLLNIIGSLDELTSGGIQLGDTRIDRLAGPALAEFRASTVGFVFQDHHLLPQLTALENVLLPSLAAAGGDATSRAVELLGRVGLGEHANSFPAQMSGGERQRIAVARAMINEPRLLLCDEPTGNLDHETGGSIVSLFLELAKESYVTVIMATHNLDLAGRLSRCGELRGGGLHELETGAAE